MSISYAFFYNSAEPKIDDPYLINIDKPPKTQIERKIDDPYLINIDRQPEHQ